MYRIPEGVEAISFDIWRTLLRGNKAFSRHRLRLAFDRLGHSDVDVELLFKAYIEADRFYNNHSEHTGRDYGMSERLEMMFSALGIQSAVPEAAVIREIQAAVGQLRLRSEYMPTLTEPDLLETLAKLRDQGFILGMLSNTGIDNSQVMELVLKQLGMWDLFEVAVFSCDDGRAKPNEGLFLDTATKLGAKPNRVLHVGDNSNADCYGADAAGLHCVLYAQKGEPEGNQYPFITSMKQLLG